MNRRLLDKVAHALEEIELHGSPRAVCLHHELERGCIELPIASGAAGPDGAFRIDPEDWNHTSLITLSADRKEVRLILLRARHPRQGALRRLITAIGAAGLQPVVVEPIGEAMPAILQRWGWRRTVQGSGWDTITEWRPA
jgi:hypothetical protein